MMKTVETVATISPTGEIQLSRLENLPVGKFRVVLVIDESPIITEEVPEHHLPENSFLNAIGDLVGCLENLPPDLSVNKQYFAGIGEE